MIIKSVSIVPDLFTPILDDLHVNSGIEGARSREIAARCGLHVDRVRYLLQLLQAENMVIAIGKHWCLTSKVSKRWIKESR